MSILFANVYAKEYLIKISHVVAEETPKGKATKYFKKRLEELSKGEIKVQIYPNASLYDDTNALLFLKENVIQMAMPTFSKLTDKIPELGLFDLPYLFKNTSHLYKVLDGEIGEAIGEFAHKEGMHVLGYWDNGFKQLTTSSKPVLKPSDIRGLSFRVMPSYVIDEQFKSLGATPKILSFQQMFQALKKDELDGAENPISNIYTQKIHQVQNYLTLSSHAYMGYIVLINKDFFFSLPKNLQANIKQAFHEATELERVWAKELDIFYLNAIKEYAKQTGKIKIHVLSDGERKAWQQELTKIYQSFYDDNLIGKFIIDEVLSLQ